MTKGSKLSKFGKAAQERLKVFFRKLGIVLWKNLHLRKSQYVVTTLEIIVPLIFLGFMFGINAALSALGKPAPPTPSVTSYDKIYEENLKWTRSQPSILGEKKSRQWCNSNPSNSDPIKTDFLAYAPVNPETTQVIQQVVVELCKRDNPGWVGVASERELERKYEDEWRHVQFRGAVVFSDELQELKTKGSTKGVISYKIRMSSDTPSTTRLLPAPNPDAPFEVNDFTRIGPPSDPHYKGQYLDSGFLGLQLAVDKVLAERLTGHTSKHELTLQPMPYPPYKEPDPVRTAIFTLQTGFFYGVIFMTASIARNVVSEKQTGISELLRMAGVSSGIQWMGWLIHAVTPAFISIILVIALAYPKIEDEPILRHADPSLFFILIWLYYFASAAFVFAICSLFKKPTIATTVAILFWIISSNGASIYAIFAAEIPYHIKVPLQFIPSVALVTIILNVASMEVLAIDESDLPAGARWSNIHVPVPTSFTGQLQEVDSQYGLSNLHMVLILMASTVFYMLLAIYLEGVLPSEHGVRRPWYYFTCDRRAKQSRVAAPVPIPPEVSTAPPDNSMGDLETKNEPEATDTSTNSAVEVVVPAVYEVETVPGFEAEPVDAPVGVDVQNIYKKFGWKMAVNGVSLRLYKGDIFALLGHNGAGKTTLISMITGFVSPTSGTAVVNGHDIRRDVEGARASMGLCPQHNMLFERLTVLFQLTMFGAMRGLTFKAAKTEATMLLGRMNLLDKARVLAMKLSGGQKRRLSLAMALIGGTQVVILDEPTSGLDPQARRDIWDLLLQLRGERTILLTTHFMEEADVLGDRIGIMFDGRLHCCGTSAFLKKFYGTGYTLKLTLEGEVPGDQETFPSPSPSQQAAGSEVKTATTAVTAPVVISPEAVASVLTAIQKHIPNASQRIDFLRAGNEVFVTLPGDTATTSVLSQLFADVAPRKEKLGIKTIGLSETTMDDVFVRVGELGEEEKHGVPIDQIGIDWAGFQRAEKMKKFRFMGQFTALLVKKFIHCIRKWILLIFEILIPLLLTVAIAHTTNSYAEPRPKLRWVSDDQGPSGRSSRTVIFGRSGDDASSLPTNVSLPISIDQYKQPVIYYSVDDENPDHFKAVLGSVAKKLSYDSDVSEKLIKIGEEDRVAYKRRHIIAAEMDGNQLKTLFNLYPYHVAPLALNLATNTLLKYSAPTENYRIQVSNHPFHQRGPERNESGSGESGPKGRGYVQVKRYNQKVYVNQDSTIKHLVMGVLPLALLFLATQFIVTPIEERLCQAKQLQTMTGVSPLVYWGAALTWDYFLYSLIIFLMLCYLLIFEYALGYGVLTSNHGWAVFLFIAMMYGIPAIIFSYLMSFRSASVSGGFTLVLMIHLISCFLLGGALPVQPSQVQRYGIVGRIFVVLFYIIGYLCPSFAMFRVLGIYVQISVQNSHCRLVTPYKICPDPEPYIKFVVKNGDYYDPGMGLEVILMLLPAFIYGGLLMLIEYRMFAKLKEKMCREKQTAFPPNMNDEDVFNEAQRVGMLVGGGQIGEERLVVQNLCKSFGGFAAVSQLHFGVHYGECFGLLGVNGAGKTTAFRMITGDEIPSMGNVFGFNTSLDKDPSKFFTNIGYCPQFDAILGHFTGKEMLKLFAGLRGVPYRKRGPEAINWLTRMGLMESANVKCGKYSGGIKRRLSTAMAMIGDPALILLDEPTSGVDPVSRRQFWRILDKMRESGQSIILTSHSMEECEALCSRIGIMVNGQFQCFGGVEHLKSKFAQGYRLTLNIKPEMAQETDEARAELFNLHERLSQHFEPCVLKDRHSNLLQYELNNPSITWDVLFKTMEGIKTEFVHVIEDYAVNESSLEDVFLAFARMQYPERTVHMSPCKKFCTCRC